MDRPQNSQVQIEFQEPEKPDIPAAILALVNRYKKEKQFSVNTPQNSNNQQVMNKSQIVSPGSNDESLSKETKKRLVRTLHNIGRIQKEFEDQSRAKESTCPSYLPPPSEVNFKEIKKGKVYRKREIKLQEKEKLQTHTKKARQLKQTKEQQAKLQPQNHLESMSMRSSLSYSTGISKHNSNYQVENQMHNELESSLATKGPLDCKIDVLLGAIDDNTYLDMGEYQKKHLMVEEHYINYDLQEQQIREFQDITSHFPEDILEMGDQRNHDLMF